MLTEALSALSPRARAILVRHYGLDGEEPWTLAQVAKQHGLTSERIRQIEAEAFSSLRARADVRSLHLACTFGRPDAYMLALNAAWREMRIGLGRESTLRALALWLFSPTTYAERPELIEALLQNALANPYPQSLAGFLRQGEAVAAHDALERLSAIRCPTLVSVAEDDILVPPRFSREIVARIHGAELRLVTTAGHGYFLERPDVFNDLSLDFTTRNSRQDKPSESRF